MQWLHWVTINCASIMLMRPLSADQQIEDTVSHSPHQPESKPKEDHAGKKQLNSRRGLETPTGRNCTLLDRDGCDKTTSHLGKSSEQEQNHLRTGVHQKPPYWLN